MTDQQERQPSARGGALETELQQAITLFNEAPVPYLLLNSQGRIQQANAAACALLGRLREVLLGQQLGPFLTPESQPSFEVVLQQVQVSGLRHRAEAQLLDAEGNALDLLLDMDAAQQAGTFVHFRVVVTDITAHKQARRGLPDQASARDEQAQAEQLEAQAVRARSLNQELEGVVHTLLQGLQLPVTRAMNFLVLARRQQEEGATPAGQAIVKAEQAVQQIFVLLGSVSHYMQIRRMRVTLRPVDLDQVLREVLKDMQVALLDRNVQIEADPLPTVQGDSRALHAILSEYLSNALKFTRERPEAKIRVLVQETDSEYQIGVEDNGAGFNMRARDKLFQLFGRLHSANRYEGTGVGLVTVRRACERFGGRVWAEGKVDQGATFWFSWPKSPRVLE